MGGEHEAMDTDFEEALRGDGEHQMYQWMEAYRLGLGTTVVQHQVRKFSLHKYKCHRHIPKTVACSLDAI